MDRYLVSRLPIAKRVLADAQIVGRLLNSQVFTQLRHGFPFFRKTGQLQSPGCNFTKLTHRREVGPGIRNLLCQMGLRIMMTTHR